jgi:hypothetical protein
MSASIFLDPDGVPWPETPAGRMVRDWVEPMMRAGTRASVANADAPLGVLITGDAALPFTVGHRPAPHTSYVVDPYSHYIRYGREEVPKLSSVWERLFTRLLLGPLARLCRWGRLSKVVMANNWLLSTNLYPPLSQAQVGAAVDALRAAYPDHAIVLRSVDEATRAELLGHCRALGARMVFSRRVNILGPDEPKAWRRNNIKNDERLRRRTALERGGARDFTRLASLYGQLYLDKYSPLNPQFTPAMLERLHRLGLMRFVTYSHEGRVAAVCGSVSLDGVSTAPVVGYDTGADPQLGLYRLAYLEMIEAGRSAGVTVNCSAGVAHFKRLRGARPALEYNAVFDAHLSWRRRLPWRALQAVTDRLVVPLMVRQDL